MWMLFLRTLSVVTYVITSVCFSLLTHAADISANNSLTATEADSIKNVALPTLPEGVSELTFNDFFKMPIGPRGLEPTEKLLGLNNKRVRIVGYMAQEEEPTPGIFMVAARTVKVAEKADGAADDLPAATLFVHMPPQDAGKVLTYRPAPWVLTGTVQLGNQQELNGHVSFVRLIMEQGDIQSDIAVAPQNKKRKNK